MPGWFHKKLTLTANQLSCAIVSFNWTQIWSYGICLNSARPTSVPSPLGSLWPFWEDNEIHCPGPSQGRTWCPNCWQCCPKTQLQPLQGRNLTALAPGTPLSLTGVIKAWPSQLNRGQPWRAISTWELPVGSAEAVTGPACSSALPSVQPSFLSSPSQVCLSSALLHKRPAHKLHLRVCFLSSKPAS